MKQKEVLNSPAFTAMLTAFVCGICVHLFGLVNILHNYDDIGQQPKGYGTGLTSGRWLLSLLGDAMDILGGNYNLPVVNGVLFLLLLACAAGVMVLAFRISSRKIAGCMGMLIVVFPTVLSTMVFRYTVVYYGVSFLMAVLAAWILERYRLGWLYSALLFACAMGIYQAYAPVTISMLVLMLLQRTLSGRSDWKTIVQKGLHYCGTLLLGLGFYFLFLKACLILYGTQLSDYQGASSMGQLTVTELLQQLRLAYYMFLKTPFRDFWALVNMRILKVLYLFLECSAAGLVIWLLFKQVRTWQLSVLALLLCMIFPIAVGFIIIMCPNSYVYTIMMYAYVMVPLAPLVLLTCVQESCKRIRNCGRIIAAALLIMVSSYAYQANVQYTGLYYANRQVENYMNALVTQVRMTEGFTSDKKWAFLGEIHDPLLRCFWQYELDYGGTEFTSSLLKRYSWSSWMINYCGYLPETLEESAADSLWNSDEVRQMPCWPDYGSIQVIGDTVVIKFQQYGEPEDLA